MVRILLYITSLINLAGNYLNNKQLKIQLWDRQIILLTNTAK